MYAQLQEINKGVRNNTEDVDSVEKTALRMEQNHGKKLEVLFDGISEMQSSSLILRRKY